MSLFYTTDHLFTTNLLVFIVYMYFRCAMSRVLQLQGGARSKTMFYRMLRREVQGILL